MERSGDIWSAMMEMCRSMWKRLNQKDSCRDVGLLYLIYAHSMGALHFLCIDRAGEIRVLQHGREIRLRSSEDPRYHGRGDFWFNLQEAGQQNGRAVRAPESQALLGFAVAASLTGARSSTGSIRWSLTCRKKLAHTLRQVQTWANPSQAGKASPIPL